MGDYQECPRCDGNGTIDCKNCGGTGWTETLVVIEEKCLHCDGSGEIQCPNCDGSGKIWVD